MTPPGVTVSRIERVLMALFVVACAILYAAYAAHIPFNRAPDEQMRWGIVDYLVRHRTLPNGWDPELRDHIWGTSYAFQPILSYMIGAVFASIAAAFGGGPGALLYAARLVSVLCGTGTVAVCVVLGRWFFAGPWRWVFPVATGLLPQFAFLSSYVNNDSLGLFSSALLVLVWVRGLHLGWTVRTSVFAGVAAAVCALSYYNCYGFLLMSILVFLGERLLAWRTADDRRAYWRHTWSRVGIIVGVSLALAGWWFARSWILYDGDLLGLASAERSTVMYGLPDTHPGFRSGLARGWTFWGMLTDHAWLYLTVLSVVGMFGYMDRPLPWWMYRWYILMALVALAGGLAMALRRVLPRVRLLTPVAEASLLPALRGPRRTLLLVALAGAVVIPWVLSLYFSWTSDFEPQGRYVLPMLVPVMVFVTKGFAWSVERVVPPRFRTATAVAACLPLAAIVVLAYPYAT